MRVDLYGADGRIVASGNAGEMITVPPTVVTHYEYVGEDGKRYRAYASDSVVPHDPEAHDL